MPLTAELLCGALFKGTSFKNPDKKFPYVTSAGAKENLCPRARLLDF